MIFVIPDGILLILVISDWDFYDFDDSALDFL